MVTQVGFSRGRFRRQWLGRQKIMGTMHAALGRGLFILLNSHGSDS
jgi:hypothetical protein